MKRGHIAEANDGYGGISNELHVELVHDPKSAMSTTYREDGVGVFVGEGLVHFGESTFVAASEEALSREDVVAMPDFKMLLEKRDARVKVVFSDEPRRRDESEHAAHAPKLTRQDARSFTQH